MGIDTDKLKKVIGRQLNIDEDKLTGDTTFVKDLGIDSIDSLELLLDIEAAFGVDIREEDQEDLLTIDDVIEYLEANS
ncbi:MAG: acyl carrier protein [bacterium]|nr:acyl carrier protein [bacterium]